MGSVMDERRTTPRSRTLRAGKIIFNHKQSVLDCVVRNLSDTGACIQVQSPQGIPRDFELIVEGLPVPIPSHRVWQARNSVGVHFPLGCPGHADAAEPPAAPADDSSAEGEHAGHIDLLRSEILRLRAAFDQVDLGIVLLDNDMRAQFINHAFRRMWKLPDVKADSKPAFVGLMYHGHEAEAYVVPPAETDAFVAEIVTSVKSGDAQPRELRMANGDVLHLQCTALPGGWRLLCYTDVTAIVRHADELEVLRQAFENVNDGVLLLDANLNVQFANRILRQFWGITEADIATKPAFPQFLRETIERSAYTPPPGQIEAVVAQRVAFIRSDMPQVADFQLANGNTIRSRCTPLPGGGRMVTYHDVTDLVRHAKELEGLATIDSLTGIFNRRHFLAVAENAWSRLQRYQRPISLMVVDIDHFKRINDQYGHEAGDKALQQLAGLCAAEKRSADVLARLGGEEFVILLPETGVEEAAVLAERLRRRIAETAFNVSGKGVSLTVSIGVAEATLGMSGVATLMRAADNALYQAKADERNKVVRYRPEHAPTSLAAE